MSLFLREVREQPQAIRDTVMGNRNTAVTLEKNKPILLTGMGSSLAASQLAALYVTSNGGMAQAIDCSELLHYQSPMMNHYNLIISSQSGESFEVKQLLEKSHQVSAITNTPGSSITKGSVNVYYTKATPEQAIASSKSFTTTVALLLQLVSKEYGDGEALESDLLTAADVLGEVLGNQFDAIGDKLVETIDPNQPLVLLGRGPSVTTAEQGGLTLKETARMYTESLSSAQFRHGPYELLREPFQCMLFNPYGKTYAHNLEMAKEIADYGGKVVYVSDEHLEHDNVTSITMKSVSEIVSPIIYSSVTQIAAVRLSETKGLVAGEASIISKVTSRE